MKKLLSIVLALTLVLGNLPVFADGYDVQPTAGENLKHYGFIQGNENGNIMPEKTLTRAELAILLAQVNGKADEAKAFAAPSGFADEKSFPAWAASYISYAKAQGWMVGKANNIFDHAGTVDSGTVAMVMLRALGYNVTWDPSWKAVQDKWAELKLDYVSSMKITRGEAFSMIWPAVSTPVAADGGILGVTIGKLEAPKPKDLLVESVKADNLKEIVVTLNHEVTKESVVDTNFSLSPSLKLNPVLQADGKTIVIAVGTETLGLVNQKQYKLTAQNLVAAADATIKLAKTETAFVAFDATLPEVQSVEFVGPTRLAVTFSEPMKKDTALPTINVKSGNSTLSVNRGGITGYGTRTLLVPLFTSLVDGTTYNIEVSNFIDFAGYKNINKVLEQTYVKDTTAPSVTVVKAEQEVVVLQFSKPVKGLHADQFAHTFTSWRAGKITKTNDIAAPAITPADEVTTVYAWFNVEGTNKYPIGAGTTSFSVTGKVGSNQIADLWGNKLADFTQAITVTADTTAPEVKELKVTAENKFQVIFTKAVTFTRDNIEVLSETGAKIPGLVLNVVRQNGTTFDVTMSPAQAGKTLVVNIKGALDTTVNKNKMVDYTATVTIGDKTGPKVVKATRKTVGSGDDATYFLYVFFNENMDDSALTATNYQAKVGADYYTLPNNGTFVNGTTTVEFPITKTLYNKIIGGDIIAANVKDAAGNPIQSGAKTATIVEHNATNVAPKLINDEGTPADVAYVTGLTEVKLYFNAIVSEIQGNPFTVVGNSVVGIQNDVTGAKSTITLTLGTKLDPNAVDYTGLDLQIVSNNDNYLKGQFDVKVDAVAAINEADKVAPTFVNAYVDNAKINVEFDQDVQAVSGSAAVDLRNDFIVTAPNGSVVPTADITSAAAGKVVTLTIAGGIKAGEYRVRLADSVNYLVDDEGNKAKKFDEKAVSLVLLESVVASNGSGSAATFDATDKLVFTFSRPVKASSGTATFVNGVLTLGDATFTFATVGANDGNVMLNTDGDGYFTTATVTFATVTTAPEGDITLAIGTLKDKDGNVLLDDTFPAPTLNW